MNAELENTWRDLVAEQQEQKRRADLFPELVNALDDAMSYITICTGSYREWHPTQYRIAALLVRCRKPQP